VTARAKEHTFIVTVEDGDRTIYDMHRALDARLDGWDVDTYSIRPMPAPAVDPYIRGRPDAALILMAYRARFESLRASVASLHDQAETNEAALKTMDAGNVNVDSLFAHAVNDIRGAQLLAVSSELCGDPKLDVNDTSDPRWTPALRDAANVRAGRDAAIAAEATQAKRIGALEKALLKAITDFGSHEITGRINRKAIDQLRAVLDGSAGEELVK